MRGSREPLCHGYFPTIGEKLEKIMNDKINVDMEGEKVDL